MSVEAETWDYGPFGWFGELADAVRRADRFDALTQEQRDTAARVCADVVAAILASDCDSTCNIRPGRILTCCLHRGHAGTHRSVSSGGNR